METEENEKETEQEIVEKLMHHLNKARFEQNSVVKLVEFMNGAKDTPVQLKPVRVKQQRTDPMKPELLAASRPSKAKSIRSAASILEDASVDIERRYERGKRTSSELWKFSQKWRLRLPKNLKSSRGRLMCDYRVLDSQKPDDIPGYPILIDETEGILTLNDVEILDKKAGLEEIVSRRGWEECTETIRSKQKKLIFQELFRAFRDSKLSSLNMRVSLGQIVITGEFIEPIKFKFSGNFTKLEILCKYLPAKEARILANKACETLLKSEDSSVLLQRVIDQITHISCFFRAQEVLTAFTKNKKQYAFKPIITRTKKSFLLHKTTKKQTSLVLEVEVFQDKFRMIRHTTANSKAPSRVRVKETKNFQILEALLESL